MADPPVNPSTAPRSSSEQLELDDAQGLVARAYGHLPSARYLLCRIVDPVATRAWLGRMASEVFTAAGEKQDAPAVNLALTWQGLRRLGLPDDALVTFPRPMQEGMVTPHRSRILRDVGESDPARWRWGGSIGDGDAASDIHVLVMVFAPTEKALTAFPTPAGLEEVVEPINGRLMGGFEHFGFADGVSQPVLKGWPRRTASEHPPAPPPTRFSDVEPGEVLLGYKDNFGKPAQGPTLADGGPARGLPKAPWTKGRRDLGRNGSFLVFRQLAQDVPAFRRAVETASAAGGVRGDGLTPARLGAKVVGRWASGASIVLHPDDDPGETGSNDFGYHDDDQSGRRSCPFGAHIRRANPRDSSRHSPAEGLRTTLNHRILRRGRPYGLPFVDPATQPGEEASAERGMIFICLNSDIERQFEFVQHSWIDNPYFGSQYGEVDPVIGTQPVGGGLFTIPDHPVRRRVSGLPSFVTTRGGAYFFLPGVKALRYLSQMRG
jgi:Dyp-type peroxidase family